MSDKPDIQPATTERRLTITALQDAMLREAQGAVLAAQQRFGAIAGTVIAGHDISTAEIVAIEPDHILVVRIAADGKGG